MCDARSVRTRQVVATGETIGVCDACDAVWAVEDELPGPAPSTVELVPAARGRPQLWSELVAVGGATAG